MQDTPRATELTCHCVRPNDVASKTGRVVATLTLVVQDRKSQSLLVYVADLARDQHRRGGRVFLTFLWNWNVLMTWPIQSVLNEAPFFCARDELC